MTIELHLLMGLNCNFNCSHCLNDSSPGKRKYDLSGTEIEKIIQDVSQNLNITHISFSGGEPLLYIENVERIINETRTLRPDLSFSLTTNSSLIIKYKNRLSKLKIKTCLISYDPEHLEFISEQDFLSNLDNATDIFSNVELNVTYVNDPHISEIFDYALNKKIKVNFTKKISSGRYKEELETSEFASFQKVMCPNKSDQKIKLSYMPLKGYSICCGPVLFDKISSDSTVYFEKLSGLFDNKLFKIISKLNDKEILTNATIACNMCKKINILMNDADMEKYLSESNWNNVLLNWESGKLEDYNILFNPKFVKSVDKNSFNNSVICNSDLKNIEKNEGDYLTSAQISDFTTFTIESFYNIHTNHYSSADIKRFKNDQNIFFKLPYRYLYHTIDGKIVAYLAVCFIEKHPYFDEGTWHIGYWGISPDVTDKSTRTSIKSDWAKKLSELNKDFRIAANIDYFNSAANLMADGFNFKTSALRLDPRQ